MRQKKDPMGGQIVCPPFLMKEKGDRARATVSLLKVCFFPDHAPLRATSPVQGMTV